MKNKLLKNPSGREDRLTKKNQESEIRGMAVA